MGRVNQESFTATLKEALHRLYAEREKHIGANNMRTLEKMVLLDTIDSRWKDHLYEMDGLKEGINWMSYAERDPLTEYKLRGMAIFNEMLASINNQTASILFHAELSAPAMPSPEFNQYAQGMARHDEFGLFNAPETGSQRPVRYVRPENARSRGPQGQPAQQVVRAGAKVGRNDPCPCGSGRKYKQCHGKNG